jgi:hypothetical protein
MKKLFLALALLLNLSGAALAEPTTGPNPGMPFGALGPKDLSRLEVYANTEGYDLMRDLKLVYQKDATALARVFKFSLKFTKLDRNARAYGQLIYSSFLNLNETLGEDRYALIVATQPVAVRQRIRDFIYYDATQAPKEKRAQAEADARKGAPLLFPSDYVFGAGNPIFTKG